MKSITANKRKDSGLRMTGRVRVAIVVSAYLILCTKNLGRMYDLPETISRKRKEIDHNDGNGDNYDDNGNEENDDMEE